jgi:hypothetical protein
VQLQLAVRGRRVDRFAQRPERDVSLLELGDDVDEMPEAAAETIQPPDDQAVPARR